MNTTASPRDYLLLLGVGLIWSSSFLLIKLAISTVPPYTLTAARIAVAVLVLAGYLILKRQGLPTDIKNWTIFAILGLFGTALPFTLISWGELYIDSGLTAVLMGTMPVATAMLAHLFVADERFTFSTGLGIMIGFGGLLILIGADALENLDRAVIAQLAIIIGALSYAVSTTFARRFARLPGSVMSTGSTVAGLIWVLPLAILLEQPWTLRPDGIAVISVLVLGIVATALATLIFYYLIHRVGATTFSQVNYIIPVFGAAWGILFLNEVPGWRLPTALVLVLCGVFIVSRTTKNKSCKLEA